MSNQSFTQKSEGQRTNHLQTESVPFALQSPQQLAQFSAATASGYHPKSQTKGPGFSSGPVSNTTNASQQNKPPTTMSPFAASFYETAQYSNGLQPPPPQPIDLSTFKCLQFVTLDGLQETTRDVYDELSGTFQWEICNDQDDRCIKHIRDECANKRVFFICSGSLGRKSVPVIHDLPQVYAIYIYCADVVSNREWSSKYTKVRVVCNNDDQDLIPQFAVDVAQANIDWGDALVKQGNRDKAKAKYQKALDNLKSKSVRNPDPNMIQKVQAKLDECK